MNLQYNVHSEAASDNYVTLNSQYLPEIDISTGEYQRWRLVNAISHAFLNISIVDKRGDSACEMYEIAADGVYYGSPRQSSHVFVTLGGRKDVLIKCPDSGWFTMYSTQASDSVVDFSDPNEFGGSLGNVRVYASDDDPRASTSRRSRCRARACTTARSSTRTSTSSTRSSFPTTRTRRPSGSR
jgi:FtsP/CotA-like multicopper oxidase with cupredoxin domain